MSVLRFVHVHHIFSQRGQDVPPRTSPSSSVQHGGDGEQGDDEEGSVPPRGQNQPGDLLTLKTDQDKSLQHQREQEPRELHEEDTGLSVPVYVTL